MPVQGAAPFQTTSTIARSSGSTVSSARRTMPMVGIGTEAIGRGQVWSSPASFISRIVRATTSSWDT